MIGNKTIIAVIIMLIAILATVGIAKATINENPPYTLVVWDNNIPIMYAITNDFKTCRTARTQILATIHYAGLSYKVTCTPVGVLQS